MSTRIWRRHPDFQAHSRTHEPSTQATDGDRAATSLGTEHAISRWLQANRSATETVLDWLIHLAPADRHRAWIVSNRDLGPERS